MGELPVGTVTFLFTDIVGSTRLWQLDEGAMRVAVRHHDELLQTTIRDGGGVVFSTMGDGFAAAFPSAHAALGAAMAAQERLAAESWSTAEPLRVRMGVHSGEVEEREGDYFGTAVNRAARLTAVAHGGKHHPAMPRHHFPEQLVVAGHRVLHRRLVLLPQPGRALDIGEQKRHGPNRHVTHGHLRQGGSVERPNRGRSDRPSGAHSEVSGRRGKVQSGILTDAVWRSDEGLCVGVMNRASIVPGLDEAES